MRYSSHWTRSYSVIATVTLAASGRLTIGANIYPLRLWSVWVGMETGTAESNRLDIRRLAVWDGDGAGSATIRKLMQGADNPGFSAISNKSQSSSSQVFSGGFYMEQGVMRWDFSDYPMTCPPGSVNEGWTFNLLTSGSPTGQIGAVVEEMR